MVPRPYNQVATPSVVFTNTPFSPLRAILICLPCATCLAFFAFLHLCTLAYMFLHEFVCRLYSNPMELWILDPNLHLSSQDTLFCLIACLFAFFVLHMFVCPCLASFASLSFSMLSFYLFFCLSTSLFPCLLHVHAQSEGMTSQAQAKRARMQAHKGQ